jgi:hypothetical protein
VRGGGSLAVVSALEFEVDPFDEVLGKTRSEVTAGGGEFCAMLIVPFVFDMPMLELPAGVAVLFGVMPPWLPS